MLSVYQRRARANPALVAPHLRASKTPADEPLLPTPDTPVYPTRRQYLEHGTTTLNRYGASCDVCYQQDDWQVRLHKCGHLFCACCVREWSRTSKECPMCRRELFAEFSSASEEFIPFNDAIDEPQDFGYGCTISTCDQRFRSERALHQHLPDHKTVCTKHKVPHAWECEAGRRAHRATAHALECPICHEVFKAKCGAGVTLHIRRDHPRQRISCELCDQVFTSPSAWWKHKEKERAEGRAWQKRFAAKTQPHAHVPSRPKLEPISNAQIEPISSAEMEALLAVVPAQW